MGINYLDDRAAMVKFTNNSEFTITELMLNFKMKENNDEEVLNNFYSYLKKEYKLSDEDILNLQENGLTMSSHELCMNEDEYIITGDIIETSLCYGIKFIRTLEYCDLFEPEIYKITYIDDNGGEHITYYNYIDNEYTEK